MKKMVKLSSTVLHIRLCSALLYYYNHNCRSSNPMLKCSKVISHTRFHQRDAVLE